MLVSSAVYSIHSFIFLSFPTGTLGPFRGFCDHTYRHTVGLLWTSDQPAAKASTYTRQSFHSQELIVQDEPLASLSGFLDHTHTDTQ
jgi:hypothetical protein